MKQIILCIVFLLVGLGVGAGGWFVYINPKMQADQTVITDLKAELEQARTQAETDQKTASDQMTKLNTELNKSRSQMTFAATQMRKMQTELKQLKVELDRLRTQAQEAEQPAEPEPAAVEVVSTPRTPVTAPAAVTSTPAGTREYTIQNGDSFWKIAANELGNGARYTEILKLNPTYNENSKLDIGKKIIIPAK